MIRKHILLIPVALSYAILAWFVYFVINPLCYNIFQQPAFVLTADFFWTKVSVPGGLADYFQTFIDQFTMFRFWGTVFLAAELFLTAVLVNRYVRKTVGGNAYTSLITHILAVAIAIVAWTDVKYPFAINMQLLLLIAIMNFYQFISRFSWQKYAIPVLAMFIYQACGPVALYTFVVCGIIGYLQNPRKHELAGIVGMVIVALLWPFIVYKFVLPIKPNAAFYDMRPQELMFITFSLSPVLYMPFISVPLVVLIVKLFGRFDSGSKSKILFFTTIAVIVVGAVAARQSRDNSPERFGFKMSVAAYNQDWNQIINYVRDNEWLKEYKNYNQLVNFYYDMALAAKGQLGDKIFGYPQRLGINGLFVDEPMATIVCLPMTILFDQMGFSTNALHYAFEAQTTYENSHYVMRYIIDELLVIGDYYNAGRYLRKYDDVMLSRKYVNDRKMFIVNAEDTDFGHGGYEKIREKHPKVDFYMGESQYDVFQVITADPDNFFANQYLLASALLQNDLDLFVNLILDGYCKVNLNALPKAYQEAVLLYRAINKNVRPDISKIHYQSYILDQFGIFQNIVLKGGDDLSSVISKRFPHTYWKYYFLDNPKVTGVSVSAK